MESIIGTDMDTSSRKTGLVRINEFSCSII